MTRYATIVADPPWHYDSWPTSPARVPAGAIFDARRTPIKYPTMSVAEITALPVRDLAADGCHIYLWTTNKYLPQSFDVLKAWGVRYSQTLVWCKTPMGKGPGGAFAQNAEYVLHGRIGSLAHLEKQDSVWFNWPRTAKHSRKPEGAERDAIRLL